MSLFAGMTGRSRTLEIENAIRGAIINIINSQKMRSPHQDFVTRKNTCNLKKKETGNDGRKRSKKSVLCNCKMGATNDVDGI